MMVTKNYWIKNCLLLAAVFFVTALCPACGKRESPVVSPPEKSREPGIVTLTAEKLVAAGIETKEVSCATGPAPLHATAAIELNGDLVSKVGSRVMGRVARILAVQGQRVKTGQVLAHIETVEVDQTWAEYLKARARQNLALANLQREEVLFEKMVTPEKDVLNARKELKETEAELSFAKDRLRLLGVEINRVEEQKNGFAVRLLIPITSPISGTIIDRTVTPGEMINPDKVLFTVADLSALWVLIDIYERDLIWARTGVEARVSVGAFPEKIFKGVISYLSNVLDEKTRTVKARVTVQNSEGLLRPGMFANVSLERAGQERMLMVPEQAVMVEGTNTYVFTQRSADTFERKNIVVGRRLGNEIEVTRGLHGGEVIVVKGTFSLKSELAKDSLQAK